MMAHVVVHGSRDLGEALRRAQTFYSLFPAGPRFRLVEPGPARGPGGEEADEARLEFDVSGYDDPSTSAPSPPSSSPTASQAG